MASTSTFNNNNNINLEKNHYYQQQSNNDSVHPLSRVTNTNSNSNSSVLDYLPTLDDVLYRHSQPPVCLYNYYIVLRDRLELETLLDFWLDVAQADILYKRYIKYSTRKASTTTTNRIQQPKPSISSSMLTYNALATAQRRSSRTSDILTHMLLLHPRASIANTMCSNTTTASNRKPPPTQHEMMETVERIYLRYIVSSAEKELNGLPHHIRESISQYFIHHTLSLTTKEVLDNPIIFAQAKNYVHQILQSTFPLFLRYKVFMNLTLPQQIGRLALGLVFLLVGFSVEFSLIFLDVHPWQKRLWGILPIVSGVFLVVTSITGIDPIWVLMFNLSETEPFHFNHIIQPRVKQILQKRSIMAIGIILLISLIFMIFFCAVAGKRL